MGPELKETFIRKDRSKKDVWKTLHVILQLYILLCGKLQKKSTP